MSHLYEAYGVLVGSNRPLHTLRAAPVGSPDVSVEFADGAPPEVDDAAAGTTERLGSHSTQRRADGGLLFRLASHGGERVWSMSVSGDARCIEIRWRGPLELADIAALVEVTGLPAALALSGVPLLHGCAVASGDDAFLVLGASGAGKSTVAAAAVASGHELLADDIAALDPRADGIRVHAGGSRLRMNADTADALGWRPDELERVFATNTLPAKLCARVPLDDTRARRVAAIFVLSGERAARPSVDRLAPQAALPLLLRNTYGEHAIDPARRAALLPFWARLARELPVSRVTPPDDIAAMPAFVAAMLPPPCAPPSSSSGRPAP